MTDAIEFVAGDSGLTFTETTDLGFSDGTTAPTDMSQCNFDPAPGYDADVKFICLAPKGTMREGTVTPSGFEIRFRGRIE